MTRKNSRRAVSIAIGFALLGLVGAVVFWGTRRAERREPIVGSATAAERQLVFYPIEALKPVAIDPLGLQEVPRSTSQPAQVMPYEQADILAKASGFVSRIPFDIGDSVEQGEVLAELWIPEMEQEILLKQAAVTESKATVDQMAAAIDSAKAMIDAANAERHAVEAAVAQHESEVGFRRSEFDRTAQLVADGAINQAVLDEKRNRVQSAEAELTAALAAIDSSAAKVEVEKSRLVQAQANLRHAQARQAVAEADLARTEVLSQYAQIKAPFDGVITDRLADTGAFIPSAESNRATPLFSICRVDRLRIVADIPESESGLICVGQSIELKVDALRDQVFRGSVQRTSGSLDPRTRTLRIEAELDVTPPDLRPGMFGLITINLAQSPR